MARGVPGESVMAVMIGSVMIWGIQPGPGPFATPPDLIASPVSILLIVTGATPILSLLRMKGVIKLWARRPRPTRAAHCRARADPRSSPGGSP